jgi:hypothetical protein
MMRNILIGTTIAAVLVAVGCGEPTRDERVRDISQTGCDRFDACGEIGSGQRYDTYSECVSELEGYFYDLWPADACGQGQINESEFDNCMVEAENFPCNSNILDLGAFGLECRAGNVCIDPRD